MKYRYFIPLLMVSSFVIMLTYIAFKGLVVGWSLNFIHDHNGRGNIVIMEAFALSAAFVAGLLALPLGYVTRKRSSLYGILLAVLGLMPIVNPWSSMPLTVLIHGLPEYAVYVLSCWLGWGLGASFRNRNRTLNQVAQATAPDVADPGH